MDKTLKCKLNYKTDRGNHHEMLENIVIDKDFFLKEECQCMVFKKEQIEKYITRYQSTQ